MSADKSCMLTVAERECLSNASVTRSGSAGLHVPFERREEEIAGQVVLVDELLGMALVGLSELNYCFRLRIVTPHDLRSKTACLRRLAEEADTLAGMLGNASGSIMEAKRG